MVGRDGSSYRPATVYYGSRVSDCRCYTSADVEQAVAVFMLTRHKHDLFHLPHNMSLTDTEARVLLRSDDGAPTGPMEDKGAGNTSPHLCTVATKSFITNHLHSCATVGRCVREEI